MLNNGSGSGDRHYAGRIDGHALGKGVDVKNSACHGDFVASR